MQELKVHVNENFISCLLGTWRNSYKSMLGKKINVRRIEGVVNAIYFDIRQKKCNQIRYLND